MEQDSPKGLNIRQPRAEREARRPGKRAESHKNPNGVQHKEAILYGIECGEKCMGLNRVMFRPVRALDSQGYSIPRVSLCFALGYRMSNPVGIPSGFPST